MNPEFTNHKENLTRAHLFLEDGSVFEGYHFGANIESEGEVVFNTGMVGYPETLSDPSYRRQILILTYPLIGNYGVPANIEKDLSKHYESTRFHLNGLIVSEISSEYSHWTANGSLSEIMTAQQIPGIYGIDTRLLTKKLRIHGTMSGRIKFSKGEKWTGIEQTHVVSEVSCKNKVEYGDGEKTVGVVDCGCKGNIINSLLKRGVKVVRVPWDYDVSTLDVDGMLFSNGPGNPIACSETIKNAKKVLDSKIPIMGICLGHQIIALASGARTYKLPFGHRSQNQPCKEVGGKRCYITSQNHGYAVKDSSIPKDFESWFVNLNDNTNEGIRSKKEKVISVQFHPEANPGPVDTAFIFDEFVSWL